jgi:RNA polymerase sigma-70 factor (ECF subfamily)
VARGPVVPGPDAAVSFARAPAHLERAALFYVRRRLRGAEGVAPDEIQSLAEDTSQEASLLVLDKLETFRGESRFLTWAAAIAVGFAMTALRRKLWRNVSLDRVPDGWQAPAETAVSAADWAYLHLEAERKEIWEVIKEVVRTDLTERQRDVLNLVVINGIRPDEVADRWGTSPGALSSLRMTPGAS